MQKIDAVVIDDEVDNTKILVHFIQKYCPLVNIVGEANTSVEAIALINRVKPKLIFLDIILDEGTGFDVLDEVSHKETKVIFVTSYDKFAIKAFKYNAIDYVLKPVEIGELIIAVNKAYEEVEKKIYTNDQQIDFLNNSLSASPAPLNFIAIPSIDKIDFAKVSDIVYLKSDGRYTIFFLTNGSKLVASRNLGEFENIVDKNQFFRIHNSYMVNLKHVLNITKTDGSYCEMSNQKSLPIAKRRKESFHQFLKIK